MKKELDWNLELDELKLQLAEEIAKAKSKKRRERFITYSAFIAIIIAILLCCKCTGDKKEAIYGKKLQDKTDLNNLLWEEIEILEKKVDTLENREARPIVVNTKTGSKVTAIIVDANDERPRSRFIANTIVEVPIPCPEIDSSVVDSLLRENKKLSDSITNVDKLLNDSIEVCMDKEYEKDSSVLLIRKHLALKSFMTDSPPSINCDHSFYEYLPNIYRSKASNSFWLGVGTGAGAVVLYSISEAIKTPVFIDGADNAAAKKRSNAIRGLRISSGVCTAISLFEFGKTIYFHNMEGKFIVGPNKIGLTLYLDK